VKPTLKPPGTKRLKPKHHRSLSNIAFKFNLRHYTLDVEQRELVGIIKTSADSLLDLINDLLDLTRVESGKLALEV